MPRPDRPVKSRRAAESEVGFDTLPPSHDGTHAAPLDSRGTAALWAGTGMSLMVALAVSGGVAWKRGRPQQAAETPAARAVAAAAGPNAVEVSIPPPAAAEPKPAPAPPKPPEAVRVGQLLTVLNQFGADPAAAAIAYKNVEIVGTVPVERFEVVDGQYLILAYPRQEYTGRSIRLDWSAGIVVRFASPQAAVGVRRGATVTVRAMVEGYELGRLALRGIRVER